jgi:hypothetical protein
LAGACVVFLRLIYQLPGGVWNEHGRLDGLIVKTGDLVRYASVYGIQANQESWENEKTFGIGRNYM